MPRWPPRPPTPPAPGTRSARARGSPRRGRPTTRSVRSGSWPRPWPAACPRPASTSSTSPPPARTRPSETTRRT
nr:MAG TPA: hypothetical protein [Caudoviricetes sp.]